MRILLMASSRAGDFTKEKRRGEFKSFPYLVRLSFKGKRREGQMILAEEDNQLEDWGSATRTLRKRFYKRRVKDLKGVRKRIGR